MTNWTKQSSSGLQKNTGEETTEKIRLNHINGGKVSHLDLHLLHKIIDQKTMLNGFYIKM